MAASSPDTKARKSNNSNSSNDVSVKSLLSSQVVLCNLPVFILVVVASLDNADKQLLASSFPVLERTLDLSVETLGYFSLFTNLSYALSLPLWGWLVHRYGMKQIHMLLSMACASWGCATIGIAVAGSSVVGQAFFRSLNGVALGSILPLSQTMLVGMVAPAMRGRAFGWMGLCEKLAGTAAAASVIYFDNWQRPHYILGFFSVAMAVIANKELTPGKRKRAKQQSHNHPSKAKSTGSDHERDDDDGMDGDESNIPEEERLSIRQIIQRITRIPAFTCLVAQGIFGGTPWDMMSFVLLLLDWRQFTKEQIVLIQFSTGMTGTMGGWVGGFLGDYAASRYATHGRILVALSSVVLGIPFYGLFLFSTNFSAALLYTNLFHLVASWPPAGALRPICADLARNPSERAQIISLWIVLEKTSGAIFGAPLVGYLTSNMVEMKEKMDQTVQEDMASKAHALASNLFGLSSFFWAVCACFWVLMAYTLNQPMSGIDKNIQLEIYKKNGSNDDDSGKQPLL